MLDAMHLPRHWGKVENEAEIMQFLKKTMHDLVSVMKEITKYCAMGTSFDQTILREGTFGGWTDYSVNKMLAHKTESVSSRFSEKLFLKK